MVPINVKEPVNDIMEPSDPRSFRSYTWTSFTDIFILNLTVWVTPISIKFISVLAIILKPLTISSNFSTIWEDNHILSLYQKHIYLHQKMLSIDQIQNQNIFHKFHDILALNSAISRISVFAHTIDSIILGIFSTSEVFPI